MSDAKAEDDEGGKKGGGMMKMIIGIVVALAVGAGGAYGAFAAGLLGESGESGPNHPELVRKGDAEPYPLPGGDKEEGAIVHGEGGNEFRTAYYTFEESFTSNLAGSPGLIQVELAASTQRDGRVLQWVHNHQLAIRSAILVQLAATPEADLFSVEGKEKLAKRLTGAINEVLEEKEGFGGVENIHFKGLLVQ
ncbi:flagellar basal body-associated FliL family protein [Qipengyuania sp. S6317L1]|uniref:flagellar basal body-associated FliL family protein n=1 Tax=Qipengyuania sp. S6317L1 TaxID=2926410 RepID=UPI001FF4354A|nr:flagellar basal body-associated FliL family protein [Qipengyuania sp. S6317L1]MCK0097878.1 flagellar basal body-associated FliL family protein [Qipengyuania sp. S6317L1]